jgi:hypothetical protein
MCDICSIALYNCSRSVTYWLLVELLFLRGCAWSKMDRFKFFGTLFASF